MGNEIGSMCILPDKRRDNVLFARCPGTPQWLDVKTVMVFVAAPATLGKCKQEKVIQLSLMHRQNISCYTWLTRGSMDRARGHNFSTRSSRTALNRNYFFQCQQLASCRNFEDGGGALLFVKKFLKFTGMEV